MKYTINKDLEGFILSISHTNNDDTEITNLDEIGIYLSCCKVVGDKLVIDETKKQKMDDGIAQRKKESEIAELKQQLTNTDYIWNVIKEGDRTEEYYADIITQRHQWRLRIRELEEELGIEG